MKLLMILMFAAMSAAAGAQAPADDPPPLARVQIPPGVLADGKPLPAGTYDLRLSSAKPGLAAVPGAAQQAVEFVSGGVVAAREVAEIVRDDDLPPVGASTQPAAPGVRVELLKGGEFLRISVKREGVRYLVHLPVRH